MSAKTTSEKELVSTIRNGVRLLHRLAVNAEIVGQDPMAVNAVRLRHRFAGDNEIRILEAAALRRWKDCNLGAPQSFEQILAVCALSRRELWQATGQWDRHVEFFRAAARHPKNPTPVDHSTMKDFADYPGVVVSLPELPATVATATADKVCRRGHAYSTAGAPSWLGGRCPTCRAEKKAAWNATVAA